jgi:hypothetical protein
LLCLAVGGAWFPPAVRAQEIRELRTVPERTGYVETSRYADVLDFLRQVDAASPLIGLDTMGYTSEGRAIPLAVVARDALPDAAAVRASGKVVVYIQANIHAGEVEGKEAALMLLREIAAGEHGEWLDSLVLLVAPIYNADGNERVSITNRPLQHGPIGGMGQRANAQGFDINRDYIKLDTPEAVSTARLLTEYEPHIALDLHTTNGTRHGYHLTYSPPLHPNTDSVIVSLLRNEWLPAITRDVNAATGWDTYYYGDIYGEGERRGWYTFDHRPRFGTNYWGLRNRVAVLSEAFSYASFEERIAATARFVAGVLRYAHRDAGRVRALVATAAGENLVGDSLALGAEFERSAAPVDILLGEVREERNPWSGAPMLLRTGYQTVQQVHEYGAFAPTLRERVPAAYYVPTGATAALVKLEQHGVRMQLLARDTSVQGERFAIDSTRVSEREFQGHHERVIAGRWTRESLTLAAGAYMQVPMDQPLARLIFTMLEPRSDDGFGTWNVFDEQLKDATTFPVLRSH